VATLRYEKGIPALCVPLDVNIPNYASAVVTTKEILDSIDAL
jgi:hypothetical protein